MRSIDADALKEKLEENRWYHTLPNGDLGEGANSKTTVPIYLADDVYRLIDNAPTIDKPVLVMFDTARWERDVNENLNIMIRFGWKCSACEKRQSYGMTPHCPFCGAEMINGSKFQEGE